VLAPSFLVALYFEDCSIVVLGRDERRRRRREGGGIAAARAAARDPPRAIARATTHAPHIDRPKIQVVPLKGLPFVGLIVIFVGLASERTGSGPWISTRRGRGTVDRDRPLRGSRHRPILGRLSIPARAEFAARFMPMMVIIMPTVVLMTLATGFQIARHLGNLSVSSPTTAGSSCPSASWASWRPSRSACWSRPISRCSTR